MKYLILLSAILAAPLAHALEVQKTDADTIITDSLVENLSCKNLTEDNVLLFKRKDALSTRKHFNVYNWSSGVLGQCWSLALSQRRMMFLGRFAEPNLNLPTADVTNTLNLIRGFHMEEDNFSESGSSENYVQEDFKVFSIPDSGLNGDFFYKLRQGDGKANFRSAIEDQQQSRFSNPLNLGMVFGSYERSESADRKTVKALLKSLEKGRAPLVVLRRETTYQHVVMIKSAESRGDEHNFYVYDSNQPSREPVLQFYRGRFYSTSIMRTQRALGVFHVDEGEMEDLQETVYKYYKRICGN